MSERDAARRRGLFVILPLSAALWALIWEALHLV
jgi:hypothetical protein